MIVAIAGIVAFAYHNNRKDALALSKDLLESLGRRIASEVHDYLNPASEMITLTVNIARDPSIGITRREEVEPLAKQILRNYPQLTIFSLADVNGNFVMQKKMPDGSIHTKIIDRTEKTTRVTWIRRDVDGNIIAEEKSEDDSYDARNRPWYQGAVKKNGVYWTDVYIFFTDQKPGITASMPVFEQTGELKGVIGLDIELEKLSAFLGNLEIGETGQALIIDAQGRLVAYHEIDRMIKKEGDQLKPVILDELDDPVLSRALNRFKIEGHGTRRLTVGQRQYINIVASLQSTLGRDWSIMIVAPEDDFVGFVKKNSRTAMLMATVIIVLTSIMAGLLAYQGLRADRNARLVLHRKRDIEAQSRAFSELASKAALFDPADTDSLQQLTEIVSTAMAVRRSSIWHFAEDGSQLLCVDSYDRESQGHTMGTTLKRRQFRRLFEELQNGKEIVVSDAETDPRTKDLYATYLHPLGCHSVLTVSIKLRGKVVGAVWLEHEEQAHIWASEEISFVRAIAGMLALRLAAQQDTDHDMPDQAAPLPAANQSGTEKTSSAESVPQPRSTTRAEAKTPKPDKTSAKHPSKDQKRSRIDMTLRRGYDPHKLGAEVFPDATVFVLQFIDPLLLAKPVAENETQTILDHLVCHFEDLAISHGLDYWKMMNDRIVGAAGLGNHTDEHPQIIADIALNFQDLCAHLFADFDRRPAFRVGIDTAAVVGGSVGREQTAYNIWGDAVQTAMMMAQTGVIGGIHVSTFTYQRLSTLYLFGVRGTYYLKEIGEMTTYLLTGRV